MLGMEVGRAWRRECEMVCNSQWKRSLEGKIELVKFGVFAHSSARERSLFTLRLIGMATLCSSVVTRLSGPCSETRYMFPVTKSSFPSLSHSFKEVQTTQPQNVLRKRVCQVFCRIISAYHFR